MNVIVYRLPHKISINRPPSHCPRCQKVLGFPDLIPVIGYLLLKGRCRNCGSKIGFRYPLVEISCGFLFAAAFYRHGLSLDFLIYSTLLYLLFTTAQIDLQHGIIPNIIIAAGLAAGLLYTSPQLLSYLLPVPEALISGRSLIDALFGMLLGGGIMLVIFMLSGGGMGAGDVKLMALIGFYVGTGGTAVVLLFGFMLGALTGIALILTGKTTSKGALPFAPFLFLATLIQVFWSSQIGEWYLNLL